ARPSDRPGRGTARLLQHDGTALGQPSLSLGNSRERGFRVVDQSPEGSLEMGGPDTHRSFPRFRGLLGGGRKSEDRRERTLGAGAGDRLLQSLAAAIYRPAADRRGS